MPDFVAFFLSTDYAQPPASFSKLGRNFRHQLRAHDVRTDVLRGATVLRAGSAAAPRFYAREDGAGWIVVKRIIFDVSSVTSAVDFGELLRCFLAEALTYLNRYEGAALEAWNARKRQA